MRKRELCRRLESAERSRDFYFFMLCKITAEQQQNFAEADRLYEMWQREGKVDGLRTT